MIDSEKIKARAKEIGIRQKGLAIAIGIEQSTVSQKINNIRPMLLSEAETIARVLKIGDAEFASYFFSAEAETYKTEASNSEEGGFDMEKEKALNAAIELAKLAVSSSGLVDHRRSGGDEFGRDVADFIETLTNRLAAI